MDQSARYSDLSLNEENLIADGKHILVAYTMTPAAGHGYRPGTRSERRGRGGYRGRGV